MSNLKEDLEVNAIKSQILKIQIIEAPGSILFGLGLYGMFVADGDAFLPILNDPSYVNLFLVIGGLVMGWGVVQTIKFNAVLRKAQKIK